MKKLYDSSPLWHALAWIGVYVVGSSVCMSVSESRWPLAVFHAVLAAALVAWVTRSGLRENFGLCRSRLPARRLLWYAPLIVISCLNLRNGLGMSDPPMETVAWVISMAMVGVLEELIFRGLLYKALRPSGMGKAIVISAVTFGLGHAVNLVNGSGAPAAETLLQMAYAVSLGFLFVLLFERSGSLWAPIASHSAIDVLSVFAREDAGAGRRLLFVALLIVLSAGYALYLWRLPTRENEFT